MTIKIFKPTHKLINKNGAVLWLPANVVGGRAQMGEPDLYTESSNQLYPLGAKLEFADGRVFRYCKHGATITIDATAGPALLLVNANAAPGATGYAGTDGFEGNLYAAAVVGQEYVDLWTIIAAAGTGYRTTVFAENFFEDGMLATYPTSHLCEYRICGSEITTTPYTRVYLDAPLKTALTVGTAGAYISSGTTMVGSSGGTGVTAYPSIYSQVKAEDAEGTTFTSAVGVSLTNAYTVNYFGWIQRRGRCIITPNPYFGDDANEREAYMIPGGGMTLKAADGTQRIGYLTQRTVSGYGDLEIWLTLE